MDGLEANVNDIGLEIITDNDEYMGEWLIELQKDEDRYNRKVHDYHYIYS